MVVYVCAKMFEYQGHPDYNHVVVRTERVVRR